jgi:hypothetical protein
MSDTLILNPKDDVAVCLRDLASGESVHISSEGSDSVIKVADDMPQRT